MPHSLPPWTSKHRGINLYLGADVLESAARLGSPCTFERAGNVLWYSDFEESVCNWDLTNAVGTGAASLSTTLAFRGSQSLKYTSRSGPGSLWSAIKYFALPLGGRCGVEMTFTKGTLISSIILSANAYNNTNTWQPGIKIDIANGELEYYNSAGAFAVFSTSSLLEDETNVFNTIKFVFDIDTGYYVRCILNNTTYDLSSYAMYDDGVAGSIYGLVAIDGDPEGMDPGSFYIDNVIFTQDEP